jgi:two-component system, cell cycle sensor histidine kinase and response regulator CckA
VATRHATAQEVSLRTGVAAEGAWVALSVTDTGTGMTQETQARIFEPFFTTKDVGKGTGLGLATSYGIINQAGGHIVVESTLGVGTSFHVFLPECDEEAVSSTRSEPRDPGYGDETVVVVEDNSFVRETTTRALRRAGYRVLSCASPAEGIDLITAHRGKVDLLLTDVVMPGMNGFEVAEEAAKIQPTMKILFVSGYGADVLRASSPRERFPLLAKPFTPAQLTHAVRRLLDDSRGSSLAPPAA